MRQTSGYKVNRSVLAWASCFTLAAVAACSGANNKSSDPTSAEVTGSSDTTQTSDAGGSGGSSGNSTTGGDGGTGGSDAGGNGNGNGNGTGNGSGGSGTGGNGGGTETTNTASTTSNGGNGNPPGPGVSVTPSNGKVGLNEKLQFTAIVSEVDDPAVTWEVEEGDQGGQVDANGLYTAPEFSGTFHVCAQSVADEELSDCGTVTVAASENTPPVLEPGIWANITPPGVTGGASGIAIDPSNPRTLYAAFNNFGIWKTVDGGTSWTQLGGPGPDPTPGSDDGQWMDDASVIAVDPNDPDHLYATNGVDGANMGFWVSQDGGESWTQSLPDGIPHNDVTTMAVDPTDFNHAIVGCHSAFPGMSNAPILETEDGGKNWNLKGPAGWSGGTPGLTILFSPTAGVGNRDRWLVTSDGAGFFVTNDGGDNWGKVSEIGGVHGAGESYLSKTGVWYTAGFGSVARSEDDGETWDMVSNVGSGLPISAFYSVIGDGNYLYATGDHDTQTFVSPEDDGLTWTVYGDGTQLLPRGAAQYRFDSANRIIYSTNWDGGIWALKVIDP